MARKRRYRIAGRSKEEQFRLLDRRRQVAEQYLRGRPQYLIAREFSLHKAQITRDLDWIRNEWRKAAVEKLDERIARELAKVDAVEAEAWAAWERSKADRQRRRAKAVKGEKPRDEAEHVEEGRDGDPRFLERIEQCVKLRCNILGIITQRHEHSGPAGAAIPLEVTEVVVRSRAEAKDLLSSLSKANGLSGRARSD